MATTWSKGTFTRPTGTGNQTVDTGTGVTGKALILFWTRQTATGYDESSGHKSWGFGFASSSSGRGCVALAGQAGVTTTNVGKGFYSDRVIEVFSDAAPTEESVADFVSFGTGGDAGKFTINWITNPGGASAIIIHYAFIGGSDVTDAYVGEFTGPSAGVTGNRAFTGVGFNGTVALFLNTNQTSTGSATGASIGMGAATSSSSRWAWAEANNDAEATSENYNKFFASLGFCMVSEKHGSAPGDLATDNKADFVSFDGDGFTLNYIKVTTGSVKFLALVLGGNFSKRTYYFRTRGREDGVSAISIGFKPSGVLFSSDALWRANQLDSESATDFALDVGSADASGNQGISNLDMEGSTASAVGVHTRTNRAWVTDNAQYPGDTPGGPEQEMNYLSTNDDGFTLRQESLPPLAFPADETCQSFVFYMAIGDSGQASMPNLRVAQGSMLLRDNSDSGVEPGVMMITGLGFQPKALIMWKAGTFDAWTASPRAGIGFATRRGGSTQQGCIIFQSDDNVSTTNTDRQTRNDALVVYSQTNLVTLSTFDSDGYTIAYTASAIFGEELFFVAIGGSDLTDANVLLPTMANTGSTQAITGAGFQPDCALFLYSRTAHTTTYSQDASICFGAASSATNEWCVAVNTENGVTVAANMNNVKVIRNDGCMLGLTFSGTQDAKWNLASFDGDGLTLNIDDLPASATTISVILCLKGGKFKAGTKAKATGGAPVDDAFSGTGFTPTGVLFANTHQTSANTIENHVNLSIGAASSKDGSHEGASAVVGADNTLPTQEDAYDNTAKCVATVLHGSTPAVQAAADMKTLGSDGFTLTWTTNDGVADIIAYLAMGASSVTYSAYASQSVTVADGVFSYLIGVAKRMIAIISGKDGGRRMREA